ncbi:hypothetical protein BDV12DRAFT_178975 [Aspergillus spectabilis]
MASTDPTPETEESDIFDTEKEGDSPTPPTPMPQISQNDQNGANFKAPAVSVPDELQILKMRISELERQTTVRANHASPEVRIPVAAREGSLADATPEQKQHQQMLNHLYDHRQQWETEIGPGYWELDREHNQFVPTKTEDGPWDFQYRLWTNRKYPRPDPFDLKNEYSNSRPRPGILTDFDYVIDYGSRRERLRKNFEWDLDRLYLMEEIDKRERTRKEEEAERKRAEEQAAAATSSKDAATSNKSETAEGDAEDQVVVLEPKLSRLTWHAFRRRASNITKLPCQIEILIGEPIIQDDMLSSYAAWYGYSGETPQRTNKGEEIASAAATGPDEAPLPERIRVKSDILFRILTKIAGSEANLADAMGANIAVVFVRPFKVLVYAERALRDWCAALEKKFSVPSSVEVTAATQDKPVVVESDKETSDGTGKSPIALKSADSSEEEPIPPEDDGTKREHEEEYEEVDGEDEDQTTKSPEAIKHLQCLLEFIDSDIVPKRSYLQGAQCRKVFFSDLWHLFRPGMEVISSNGKQVYRVVHVASARHRVVPAWQRYHNSVNNKAGKAPFSVTCVYIDFDGKSLGPVSAVFDFKRFDGQRDITSLEIYPLQLHALRKTDFDEEEWKEIEPLPQTDRTARFRQRLVDRGNMFLQVAQVKHMYYAGPTLGVRDEVESQVVVDFETAFAVEDPKQQEWKPKLEVLLGNSGTEDKGEDSDEDNEGCHASCCRSQNVSDDTYVDRKQRTEYIESLLPKTENSEDQPSIAIIPRPLKDLRTGRGNPLAVSEEELLIMSYRVFGFVLRTRKWAKLDLSYLTEVHPPSSHSADIINAGSTGAQEAAQPPTTFSRLVLNEKHKHMIVSLIAQHFRDKKSTTGQREQVDIVRGKGKGLILLLHGAPGVGKTSTAEGVAELFQKPLFQITCGDLGTTASEVEKALETTFALANRWDCILLLDEADVFLSQRTKDDFQRNGLVAVFLRVMEYYAGILFLTTNRVGDFDEAFTSRIHVSLYYPDLSPDQTVKVFKLNMDLIQERFNRKGRRIAIDHYEIAGFASQYYNDHPDARWNGRQIRNACQTALALAEFEAQGNDHQEILRPDAIVTLTVGHFETVRDAYLEFTDYINTLWGTNASTRAHEDKLRPVWVDANNNIVAHKAIDKKAAFFRAAQRHSHAEPQHAQPPAVPHPDQYYSYGSPPAPPSGYHPNPPPQRPAYPANEPWNTPTRPSARAVQNPDQVLTPPQHGYNARMQTPRNPGWSTQDPESLSSDQEPPYAGHEVPHGLGSVGRGPPARGHSPAQSWSREVGGH